MIQKRQLVQPVQDQVFNAVQEIGLKREYDFIFENSAEALMLFSANRHDISDQVLTMIERTSRKTQNENRANEVAVDPNEPYKSVEGAKNEAAEEAKRERERQAQVDERESMLDERQRKRDSARAARQAEYEERRRKLLEDRERRRDSLEQARNK